MLRREIILSFFTFTLISLIQEAIFNQIRLPFGGFSLILLAALLWSSISEPEIAAVTGFIAGILMDLSPSNEGFLGHWTLVVVISCFVISYLSYGNESLNSNPTVSILLTATLVIATIFIYLIIGVIFGLVIGTFTNVLQLLLGFGLWSALMSPIVVPFIAKAHAFVYKGIQ